MKRQSKEFYRGYLFALVLKYGPFAKVAEVIQRERATIERIRMIRRWINN